MAVVYTRYARLSITSRPRLTETLPTSALHRRAPLGGSQPRRRLRRDPRGPAPRLPALLSGQIAEEFGECPVVGAMVVVSAYSRGPWRPSPPTPKMTASVPCW